MQLFKSLKIEPCTLRLSNDYRRSCEDIRSHLHLDAVILKETREDHTKILRIWSVRLFSSLWKITAHFLSLPLVAHDTDVLKLSAYEVCSALFALNPRKASSYDGLLTNFSATLLFSSLILFATYRPPLPLPSVLT